ncbi:MarR family winged helix-turn-helix transcriptional regulator [Kribbella sp. NPDC058245]|uniref:MarR family winged helix-turn-helix transcriptional regulator n=1 Tax=Kribbella sp. NPDC058245 TaxID=3346399 RepID=UPI0036EC76DF
MAQADPPTDPPSPTPSTLLGREFATAIVVFHETVGRLLGLSSVERKCLDVLDRLGPVTAGAIAEHTGLTTGAVTGLADRLEKAGYARRTRDPHDRRKVLIELVPNERRAQLTAAAFGPFGADMAEAAAKYTPAELAVISDWVATTTDILVNNTRRITALVT